jgi:hypothetical protein
MSDRYQLAVDEARAAQALLWVNRGIWAYFWLLILEGVLRKWVVPQLSAPLLIVRDPVVLFIYWQAFRSRKVSAQGLLPIAAFGLAFIFLAGIQLELRLNNLPIALYGLRSYVLHLPLIFIMKQVLTMEDVKKFGRVCLILSIPMTLLMAVQYRGSPGSWVNAGAGGGEGQIRSAGEHVRAAGTFSFATGPALFFPLVAAFLIFAISEKKAYSKRLLIAAAAASVMALPLSGSRTFLLAVAFVVMVGAVSMLRSMRLLMQLAGTGVALLLLVLVCAQLPIFQDSLVTLQTRWEDAAQGTGGTGDSTYGAGGLLKNRLWPTLVEPFEEASKLSWLGEGIGMGSNVAAALTTGSAGFLLSENPWLRLCQEVGPVLGLAFIGYRVFLCAQFAGNAWLALRRKSPLALLLASATLITFLLGLMEQPTSLGFMVFGAGLTFAAAKRVRIPSRVRITAMSPQPAAVGFPIMQEASGHGR